MSAPERTRTRWPPAPRGPLQPSFWRSPLRGPWLTAALGSALLVLVSTVAVTGFLSHVAYNPDLPGNAIVPAGADLPLNFDWPTGPSWLYAVTQGLHVNVGLMAVPLLLAKLWSVMPRLFAWPPVTSPAQAIERLAIALLVSSTVFQFVTGIMNAQYWYAFGFNFVVAHYYGAVVFTASLALHVIVKTPVILRAHRDRGWLRPLRDDLRHTRPEPRDEPISLAPADPDPPTISRRGLFAFLGGASALLLAANVGQTIGGPLRSLAFLAPRREDFPINRTAARARITPAMVGAAYRLTLASDAGDLALSRDELLALPQHTATLPIACVEGWTTTQEWTGVRLSQLAEQSGADPAAVSDAFVRSLQPAGVLSKASLSGDQVRHPDALLALKVNGADLSLDHGFPARIIVPALPGVHNTKWVGRIEFS
jgi:DMSO/TMAO reductase YedYZ molybdopterin-dependent catalytic subunit